MTNKLKELSPLLHQNEVAEYLGIEPRTLELWRSQGRGPSFIRLGYRSIRYRFSDVVKYLETKQVESS